MKKQLMVIFAIAGLASSAFGQGQVILANNAATVTRQLDGVSGVVAPINSLRYQLYSGIDAGSLAPLLPTTGTSANLAGRIANATYFIPSAPNGQTATFQIWAWSSAFATYADALAGDPLTSFVGKSVVFTSATSFQAQGAPTPTAVSLAGKYAGIVVNPVPEPSTIALGILGAGSLLFLRRKK